MPHDEGLAARVRRVMASEAGPREGAMCGGLAMLVDGSMAVGVYGDGLLVRTSKSDRAGVLAEPGVHEFAFGHRPLRAFVLVDKDHCATARQLGRWVALGVACARRRP